MRRHYQNLPAHRARCLYVEGRHPRLDPLSYSAMRSAGSAPEPGESMAHKSGPAAPPWWVITISLGVGSAFVFGTTYGGHVRASATAPREPAPPKATPRSTAMPNQNAPPPSDWRSALVSTTCSTPCARGPACVTNPTRCTSGLTCIPGTGREPFASDETWMLHLSAVQETGPDGTRLDPCQTGRDFWACRSGTNVCASQRDACAHGSKSTIGIPITGAEIATRAIVLDVREGGPDTPTIATPLPIQNLTRTGLCNGFGRDAIGGAIARVTYFLLPL